MKFGVNYTPSHGWFHAWLDPDWDGIDNDLKQISELANLPDLAVSAT